MFLLASLVFLSPTDFSTRLLLCSAIRVNSIALAYRNNCTDDFDFFSFFDSLVFGLAKNITPFGRDYCFVRHSSSKLDSALTYRKKSLVGLTQIFYDLRSIGNKFAFRGN